ncbi:MAG: Uma2 family endonuclease [Planctomycetia bacterium]|nr:Uma2 family endonuclease [Planctomycetia bacterium]
MSVPSQQTSFTPEDLLHMPDGKMFELVHGQLVEKNMGFKSARIGLKIAAALSDHVEKNGLGWVNGADAGYQCFPDDPSKVRKPDVSFIRGGRLAASDEPRGHCTIAPDLAVEVVSPNDEFSQVSTKVHEYLDAAVQLVWVVDPVGEEVLVYRQDGTRAMLTGKDYLDGESVVPGYRCLVADLFKPPAGVATA